MKKEIKGFYFMVPYLATFHVAFIILMGIFARYKNETNNKVPEMYASERFFFL